VNAVRDLYDGTQALARTLLPSARNAQTLERALQNPQLHVAVEDRPNGVVYEWENGAPSPRTLPAIPPGAPPPQDGPIQQQGPPQQGPPQQGPPGNGPQQGPPPRPRTPLTNLAGALVNRQPFRIGGPTLAVILAPNVDSLGQFLLIDAITTFTLVLLAIAAAAWMIRGLGLAERRRLEATLEERRAAAKEFQRFLGDAGHELRTPLTIISGYVEIISRDLATSEHGARILEGLQAETGRMRALVEKMLLLARLESPVSVPRLVDVGNVAKEHSAMLRHHRWKSRSPRMPRAHQ
jgi:hypothetical protein